MMQFSQIHNNCPLSMKIFRLIRDRVNQRFGIFFNDDDRYLLESRLTSRVTDLQLTGFEQYFEILQHGDNDRELDNAIEVLTNNETYFFREDYQLNAFAAELLPIIQARNERTKQLTVWSAGCSSGEEVYSIAIFLVESRLFPNWDIRVFGSDVSSRMLTKARHGIFSKSAFRNTPDYLRRKYFTPTDAGWQLKPIIRDKCNFGKINLRDHNRICLLGKFDAIFCRNVLMYFDKKSRFETISTFHERLHPLGYLLLGHTESLFNHRTPFEQVDLKDAMVYQRREGSFD